MAPARTLGLRLGAGPPLRLRVREARSTELGVAIVTSGAAAWILGATGGWLAFAVVALVFVAVVGALRPALFLALVLAVRPLLDQVSGVTLGVRSANVDGALALSVILVAALTATRLREVSWPRAAPALLIALAASAVSAVEALLRFGSAVGTVAATEVVRVAALFAVYVLAANVAASAQRSRRLFVVAGLSGVVPGVLGIVEWISGPPIAPDIGLPRISGPFVGPVPFGAFLAVTALILLFLPRADLRPTTRLLALLAVCVPLVGSLSREGWFLFIAGVVILGWRARRTLLVVVTIVLVGLAAFVPTVRERALPVSTPAGSTTVTHTYESWHWRTKNWRTLLGKWRQQPVFGFGLRSTTYVNPRTPVSSRGKPGGGFDAHNLVVRLLVEGGVVLLAAYAVFFAALLRSSWRLARDRWELRPLGKLLCALWALLLVVGFTTDDPFSETAVLVALLALTGSLEAAHRTWQRERALADAASARASAAR